MFVLEDSFPRDTQGKEQPAAAGEGAGSGYTETAADS